MGFKTNARGGAKRTDLISLTCINCGKPFNCPPEYLDVVIDSARVLHPICYFNAAWRHGITDAMLAVIEGNRAALKEQGYCTGIEEKIKRCHHF